MESLPLPLQALAGYKQFILWAPERLDDGSVIKRPISYLTGKPHDPHDPAIWLDFETALAFTKKFSMECGVGFTFTEQDPFWFLDIDKCLDSDNQWSQLAQDLCTQFQGCAVEVSQSGRGLHIFGSGQAPKHGCKNKENGLEFYTEKRFVALTGSNMYGDITFSPQPDILNWFISRYFPPGAVSNDNFVWTTEPVEEWNGPKKDKPLIERMLKSSSAASVFGNRATIRALWEADPIELARCYPPFGNTAFDHSSADMALCSHLAFWTGKDCERIDRLFRKSALFRDKWEKREPYRKETIGKSVEKCKAVYSQKPKKEIVVTSTEAVAPLSTISKTPKLKSGPQFLNVDQQIELFKDCAYVQQFHSIFTPDGQMLEQGKFRATYGGYRFILDDSNEKITNNAWEAFTESQVVDFPKVHGVCFRPNLEPGVIILEEGRKLINIYTAANTEQKEGDPTPFLDLVNKLFPEDIDREIIMAYIAAVVQYPGVKFQWAPVIQGVQGNGKSLLSGFVAHAVGLRYTHKVSPNDIGNVFNAWITGRLFIAADEIYINDKKDKINALKPLITDDRVAITPKGVDQYTGDNVANFMCTMNPMDGIRKTRNDRRFAVFVTPQQSVENLNKCGMGGTYFYDLVKWSKKDGYAIVNNFLKNYQIPDELNPATRCNRAPTTTSTVEAIEAGLGAIEQEVIESIQQERTGFAKGWVSSMALDQLFEDKHIRLSRNKRTELLEELGYIKHPGLKAGRVNNNLPTEGGKPLLYIKDGHIHTNLTQNPDIVRCYLEAQGVAMGKPFAQTNQT